MNIITKNPVMSQAQWDDDDYSAEAYSNASAATRRAKRSSRKKKRRAKGTFGERFGRTVRGVQDSGILDVLSGAGRGSTGGRPSEGFDQGGLVDPTPYVPPVIIDDTKIKKPMKKVTKILIGVGIAAVVGVGVYMLLKKKKGASKGTSKAQ